MTSVILIATLLAAAMPQQPAKVLTAADAEARPKTVQATAKPMRLEEPPPGGRLELMHLDREKLPAEGKTERPMPLTEPKPPM